MLPWISSWMWTIFSSYYFLIFVIVLSRIISHIFYRPDRIRAKDRAVFISGCDSGIGHQIALHLDQLGFEVIAGCLDPENARKTLSKGIRVLQLDITQRDSVDWVVDEVKAGLEAQGKVLWAVINNAGVCMYGHFEWYTWNHIEKQVEVNLLGTIRMSKAFLPLLRRSKGRLITITSVNGSVAYPGISVYSATKYALEGFMDGLRLEEEPIYGIRAVVIRPGDYARLTGIMRNHEAVAEEMWDAMPAEDQQRFQTYFPRYHEIVQRLAGMNSPANFKNLLDDVEDALLSPKPLPRYTAAPVLHRGFYLFLRILPATWRDTLIHLFRKWIYWKNELELPPALAPDA